MVIADTSVWIDLLRGDTTPHTDLLATYIKRKRVGVADLILCELLQGIADDRTFFAMKTEMEAFAILPSGGRVLADAAAQNYRYLRTRGITVRKTVDCLIATLCILQGHSLIHRDRDFDPFEQHLGLHVIHP